jgi:hypothetical protein
VEDGEVEVKRIVGPALVEIPRKITLFRVLMERKLGWDWEHSF